MIGDCIVWLRGVGNSSDGTTSGSRDGPATTSGGNASNTTIIDSGIGITSGNGDASGDIQLLEVVSVSQVAAATQLGAALVLPLSVMVVPGVFVIVFI